MANPEDRKRRNTNHGVIKNLKSFYGKTKRLVGKPREGVVVEQPVASKSSNIVTFDAVSPGNPQSIRASTHSKPLPPLPETTISPSVEETAAPDVGRSTVGGGVESMSTMTAPILRQSQRTTPQRTTPLRKGRPSPSQVTPGKRFSTSTSNRPSGTIGSSTRVPSRPILKAPEGSARTGLMSTPIRSKPSPRATTAGHNRRHSTTATSVLSEPRESRKAVVFGEGNSERNEMSFEAWFKDQPADTKKKKRKSTVVEPEPATATVAQGERVPTGSNHQASTPGVEKRQIKSVSGLSPRLVELSSPVAGGPCGFEVEKRECSVGVEGRGKTGDLDGDDVELSTLWERVRQIRLRGFEGPAADLARLLKAQEAGDGTIDGGDLRLAFAIAEGAADLFDCVTALCPRPVE